AAPVLKKTIFGRFLHIVFFARPTILQRIPPQGISGKAIKLGSGEYGGHGAFKLHSEFFYRHFLTSDK
ncbi:MAG: hypothetical protein AB7E95_11250, partial [Kiritimatiellales bacterium]